MVERGSDGLRYTAFLSYSHTDTKAASRLHRRLETFRMPRHLVGKAGSRGPVPERLWPIFRDRDELPAATDLSETVRDALSRSGALIVLCSPHAAQSLWVAEEIRVFRDLHPDRPILAAVFEGDPDECFPATLRAGGTDGLRHEPLATDLRPQADGARLGLLKLVAGITGVGLDDLVQRDASRRIRRVMAVTAVAVAAMIVLAATTLVAIDARREAQRQHAEAEGLVEYMLTDVRPTLKTVGRLDILNKINRRAMAYYERQGPLEKLTDDSLERRARVIGAMGEDDENGGNFRLARIRYEALFRTTAALLAKDPDNPARILAHARSENRLGLLAYVQNQLAEAIRRWDRTERLLASIDKWGWNRGEWLQLASYVEVNSGAAILRMDGDKKAALSHCRRGVFFTERLLALRPDDSNVTYDKIFHLFWLAEAENAVGLDSSAGDTRQQYLALIEKQKALEPNNMLWLEQQMELYVRHARLLEAQGGIL